MLACQLPPHLQPRLVQEPTVDHGVGAREVDELEDAEALAARSRGRRPVRRDALGVDGEDLSGLDVAHERGADRVECRALRRDGPSAARQPAEGQRPEADRVACRDEGIGGQHREREGAARPTERMFDAMRPRPSRRVRDELHEDLGVRAGGELDALLGQLVAQPARVREVAVVAEHHLAEVALCVHRLHVRKRVRARGAVPGVADRRDVRSTVLGLGLEACQGLLVEDAAHEPEALVQGQPISVRDGDSGGLLPAVLERMESDVGHANDRLARSPDPHDAALLARATGLVEGQRFELCPRWQRALRQDDGRPHLRSQAGRRRRSTFAS
jgi:hypothetical protein